MKPSLFAVLFLLQLLAAFVRVESTCECDSIDTVTERFFVPEDNTPLDQGCLNVLTEPALQDVHDSAEPSGSAFTRFLLTKNDCDDPNEDFLCELTNVHGSQEDTFHEESNFHYFVNVESIAGDCYSPQNYNFHKITCPGFWMVNLCVPGTMDLPASDGKCIDEIRIGERPTQTVLCGKSQPNQCLVGSPGGPVNPSGQFELIGFGNFIMTSGKSQCCGGCGYRFSVTCLNQPPQVGRKRRSVSEAYIEERMKRHFSPSPKQKRYGGNNMLVQNGMFVSYIGKTVTVFNSEGVLRTFNEIKVFQVYDVLTGFSTFSPSSEAVTYEGYGYLMISYGRAYYLYERAPPYLQLTKQDKEDIQNFVPLIHEGLYNETNQPNSTREFTTPVDKGDYGKYGKPPGKKPGKRSRDRRNIGLASLEGQCDPMCEDPGNDPSTISCSGATFGSQARKRRHTQYYGQYDYVDPEMKKNFYRALQIVKDPDANPFVERYARAYIYFFKKLYHGHKKYYGHPKYYNQPKQTKYKQPKYKQPKYYGRPKHSSEDK